MSDNFKVTTDTLIDEGNLISLKLDRGVPGATTLTLSWVLPANLLVTQGVLVLLSTKPMNPSNFPADGEFYTGSTVWGDVAAATIGANDEAQVVGAFYSLTGVPLTLTVTDIAPYPALYYASIHAVSNIRQYHTSGSLSYPLNNTGNVSNNEINSGDIPSSDQEPKTKTVGQVWYNSTLNTVSMWTGSIWVPAGTDTVMTGSKNPDPATLNNTNDGQFFYNTSAHDLFVLTSGVWVVANTANQGTPMYEKPGVGTDGTQDERANLIKSLQLQLGWPIICVELKEAHFDMAIDNALAAFRSRADNAYTKSYIMFGLKAKQQIYYLNDPVIGTNRSVDVIKIYRLGAMGGYNSNDSGGLYSQTFLNQLGFGQMGKFDLVSIHLMANLSEELEHLLAGNLMYTWQEASRMLTIQRRIMSDELVILECVMERYEQDLLTDRWCKNWLREWAYGKLLESLGNMRSKFGSYPGPNGGISLNGSELLQRADTIAQECNRQLNDYEVGNNSPEFISPLMIG